MSVPAKLNRVQITLKNQINKAQGVLERSAKHMVETARDLGGFLHDAKREVGHGNWMGWLPEHCPRVSHRQAQKYMRLHDKWPLIEAKATAEDLLTIDGTLDVIKEEIEPRSPKATSLASQEPEGDAEGTADSPDDDDVIDLDQEPRDDFGGYNQGLLDYESPETPRVYLQEFRDLWEDADADGRAAIVAYAMGLPEFKASIPKAPAKRRSPKKKTGFDPRWAELPYHGEFVQVWGDWCDHRDEIKKSLTKTSTRQQLKKMEEFGEDRAIAALKHTMANGWQGIREPESDGFASSFAQQKSSNTLEAAKDFLNGG